MNDCRISLQMRSRARAPAKLVRSTLPTRKSSTGALAMLCCVLATGLGTGLWSGQAQALALGDIDVQSRLNQPMRATIPVLGTTPAELESLNIKLASPQAFERAGVPLTSVVRQLQFTVVPAANGRSANVLVVGQSGAREPFIDLLVEANWRSGNIVRNYTILLDPPQTIQQAANDAAMRAPTPAAVPPAVAAPVTAPPVTTPSVMVTPEPVAPAEVDEPTDEIPFDELPIAKTYPLEDPEPAQIATFDEADSVSSDDPEYFGSGAGWVEGEKPVQGTARHGAAQQTTVASTTRRYGPVAPKETLWSIAYGLRTDPSITMDQMQLGIYRANPSAFVGGNINRMLKGSMLTVPPNVELRRIDAASAKREVARHRAGYTGPVPAARRSSSASTDRAAAAAVQPEPDTDRGSALDTLDAPTSEPAQPADTAADTQAPEQPAQRSDVAPAPPATPATPEPAAPREPSALERLAAGYGQANTDPEPATPATVPAAGEVSAPQSPQGPAPEPEAEAASAQSPEELLAALEASQNTAESDSARNSGETASALDSMQMPEGVDPDTAQYDPARDDVTATGSNNTVRDTGASALDNMQMPDSAARSSTTADATNPATSGSALDRLRAARERENQRADGSPDDSAAAAPQSQILDGATGEAAEPATDRPATRPPVVPAADAGDQEQDKGGLPWLLIALAGLLLAALGGAFAWFKKRQGAEGSETAHAVPTATKAAAAAPAPTASPASKDAQPVDQFADTAVAASADAPASAVPSAVPASGDVDEHGFDSTMIMQGGGDATPSDDASDASGSGGAATADDALSTDTISLDLSGDDPLAEADVHLAFGAYDEAIETLKGAAAVHPERAEIKTKLAEVYFAAENKEAFLEHATRSKAELEVSAPGEWQKIAIMGQQLAPESALFAGSAGSTGAAALDVTDTDFDLADDAPSDDASQETLTIDAPELESPQADIAAAEPDLSVDPALDIDANEIGQVDPIDETSEDADGEPSTDEPLEFDLGDFDLGEDAETAPNKPEAAADSDERALGDDKVDIETPVESPAPVEDVALDDALRDADDELDLPTLSDDPLQDLKLDDAALDIDDDDADSDELDAMLDLGDFDLDMGELEDGDDTTVSAASGSDASASDDVDKLEKTATDEIDALDDFADFDLSDDLTSDDAGSADKGPDADADVDIDAGVGVGVDSDADEDLDLDLDFGFDDDLSGDMSDDVSGDAAEQDSESASEGLSAEGDEMETKLDLARAYAEMGDADLARGLIEEVVEKGSDDQVQEAKDLLSTL